MFSTRTAQFFIKATKILRNAPLSIQNVQLHTFKRLPLAPSSGFLKYEMKITLQARNYAKNKDRKKEKGRFIAITNNNANKHLHGIAGKTKVHVNEALLSEVVNVAALKNQMDEAIEYLKDDFTKHLSLRSTTGKCFVNET